MGVEKKYTVLCVDDEKNILNSLKRLLRKENYELLTASSGPEGLQLMDEKKVHLVISDQRMPEMSGTDFLEKVKEKHPDVLRIILTGYTEVDAITGAINKGNIYKFFLKPWNDETLKLEIRKALEQYDLVEQNKTMADIIKKQNEELKIINDSLEKKVEERTHALELRNQALELSRIILDQLPFPVLGVDNEGYVAMANMKMMEFFAEDDQVGIGSQVGDFLSKEIEDQVVNATLSAIPLFLKDISMGGKTFSIESIPLSGRFKNKGSILIFRR